MTAMRRTGTALCLAAGLLLALPAAAAPVWGGAMGQEDGAPLVMNPKADPADQKTIKAVEQWRLGGENEDDPLLGLISDVAVDADGNAYLLDSNLSQIHVMAPGGEHLRVLGREGEGPGEFRAGRRLALLPGGDVAVMQMLPGQIVVIGGDGTPRPSPQLEGFDGGMRHFEAMAADARGFVVGGMSTSFGDGGITMTQQLARWDREGASQAVLCRNEKRESGNSISLGGGDEFSRRWVLCGDGRVVVFGQEDVYRLEVYGADGARERVITREYDRLKQTDEALDRQRRQMEEMRERFSSNTELEIEQFERDVQGVVPRPDGGLWVGTGRGARRAPEGSLGWFDVLDADGRLTGSVLIEADYDPARDNYVIRGDRLFVLKEAQMTSSTMSAGGGGAQMMIVMSGGGGADDDEDEEAMPFEVICYRLP
jgi:hypothetical protein